MKRFSLIIAIVILSIVASFAQNVEVDGITYTLSDRTATVAKGTYSGNVVIPEYIQVDGSFYDVTKVADRCFQYCSDIETITFNSPTLEFLGDATFEHCHSLHFVEMPKQCSRLGVWSFADCPSLQTINLPEGITTLGTAMFKNSYNLKEITLPSSLAKVEIDCFYGIPDLETVYLNAMEAPINQSSQLPATTKVVIPDGYKDGYNSTWCGAIVYERSEFESPTAYTTLKAYIEMISESGVYYEAGTTPGTYPIDKVDEFELTLVNAIMMLDGGYTEEEYTEAYNNLVALREDLEKSFNPIVDGYYYIINAYNGFIENQGVEKAMNTTGKDLTWGTLDKGNPTFVFHIIPQNDGTYTIQNFANEKYINASAVNAASQKVLMSNDDRTAQTITPIGQLQWLFANKFCGISYHPESHNGGAGKSGNIVTYNENKVGEKSTWRLEFVDASAMDSLAIIKGQMALNDRLEALVEEAYALSEKTATYITGKVTLTVDEENPEKGMIISNAKDSKEGTYGALVDGDWTGNVFFHSTYHDDPGVPHYLQITLPQPLTGFEAKMARRSGAYGYADAPTQIAVYATNNPAGEWTLAKTFNLDWTTSDIVTTPNVQFNEAYKYIRLTVLRTNENRHTGSNDHPFFCLGELEINAMSIDVEHSQYYYMEGMKEAVDKMTATADELTEVYKQGAATQTDIDALQHDIDAVLALFVDTVALNQGILAAQNYLDKTEVGDGFGQTTQEALDALQAALNSVKGAAFSDPLVKADVDAATKVITEAIAEFIKSVKGIEPNTWYYISSADIYRHGESGEDDAFCNGSVIYAGGNNEDNILWGLNEGGNAAYHYNPHAMWQFIPAEGTNQYYVQCLGNGFYLGDATGNEAKIKVSFEPVPYYVNFLGGGQFELCPANPEVSYALHAKGSNNNIVSYKEHGYETASAWTFTSVQDEDDMIVYSGVLYNFTDVLCLPYNHSGLADLNDDVRTLAVKKMTQEEVDGQLVTTIELYQKDEFAAGEPCIIWVGDPQGEFSPIDLVLPFPTEVTSAPKNGNGISGCLNGTAFPGGTAYSSGHEYIVSADGVGIGAQTGVIDPATYKGEVTGVPTAMTLTLTGLRALPKGNTGDVNGDGIVNAADVVTVYNYIISGENSGTSKETADVNADGTVNAADVVSIYNAIIDGSKTGSKRVRPSRRIITGE